MRLLIGVAALAIAAFAVIPPPHPTLDVLGVVATEWGHLLAFAALVPLWPGWRHSSGGRIGGVLGVVAAAIAITSTLQAVPLARNLPARVESAIGPVPPNAFCGAAPRASALVVSDLFVGVRPRPAASEELNYTVADGEPLKIGIRRSTAPDCPSPAPAVILVDGPTWETGEHVSFNDLENYLAARGYAVVTIGHRRAPRWQHPDQSDDISSAIAYVRSNGDRMGIDASRLALMGRSMQGHLAMHAAYRRGGGAVRGVIAMYAPSDLERAYAESAGPPGFAARDLVASYLGGTPVERPAVYRRASAVTLAGAGSPPTLLIHGARDHSVPVSQSVSLDEHLARAGARHLLVRLPWAVHGCDMTLSGPCGQISTYVIERFLAAVLRG